MLTEKQITRCLCVRHKGKIMVTGETVTELEIKWYQLCYRNARTTYALCAGHGKAADNHAAMERYAARLEELGASVPDHYEKGSFNGVGSQ